jgi:hybrid cluster-associated redox disulfide protein
LLQRKEGQAIRRDDQGEAMLNPDLLSPEMCVADLLDECPQAIAVFLRHHMACVGCLMSSFDTLAEAARNHDIPAMKLLDELRCQCASDSNS